VPAGLREHFPQAVGISAKTGEGVPQLLAELGTQLRPVREVLDLRVPQEQAAVIARIHAVGQVVSSRYGGKNARFKVRIPPHLREEFSPFMVE
jgi:GTP-binding protein HflX